MPWPGRYDREYDRISHFHRVTRPTYNQLRGKACGSKSNPPMIFELGHLDWVWPCD
jgi:hypothetical protein